MAVGNPISMGIIQWKMIQKWDILQPAASLPQG
jgi:hypothetical protein